MTKSLKLLIILICLIFIGSLVSTFIILKTSNSKWVEIVQNDTVLYTLDLSTCENQNIDIEYNGSHNVVTIQDGNIFISKADCNDNTCVKMGILKYDSLPIVCLPNRLIIRFKSED